MTQAAASVLLALDRFSVHAQWGPRTSSAEEIAALLAGLLPLTTNADSRIQHWFPADDDRFGFTATADTATRLDAFTRLVAQIGDGDPPVVRLEMETADVDGTGTPNSALDVTAGAHDPYEPNHVTWALLDAGPAVLASPTAAISLLRALIGLTDPDWAAISSTDIDAWQPIRPDGPTLGWATYLAYRLNPPAKALADVPGVTVEPVHRGYLLIVAGRPEHTAEGVIRAISTLL